jgi:hypothetical protein
VSIINCTVADNSAAFFGGGVFIGGLFPSTSSTCSLNMSGTVISANYLSRAGTQLYTSCGGSIDFSNARFALEISVLEVIVLAVCAASALFELVYCRCNYHVAATSHGVALRSFNVQ